MSYKKGAITLGDASAMALGFVLFILIVAMGASVLAGVKAGQTSGSIEANITGKGLDGLESLGDQSPTIGVVLGAAVIIGILILAFGAMTMRQ